VYNLLPILIRPYVDRTIGQIGSWIKFRRLLFYYLHEDGMEKDFKYIQQQPGESISQYRRRFNNLKIQVMRKRRYLYFPLPSSAELSQRFRRGLLPGYTDAMLNGADTVEEITRQAKIWEKSVTQAYYDNGPSAWAKSGSHQPTVDHTPGDNHRTTRQLYQRTRDRQRRRRRNYLQRRERLSQQTPTNPGTQLHNQWIGDSGGDNQAYIHMWV
jgi:hypothetical protein